MLGRKEKRGEERRGEEKRQASLHRTEASRNAAFFHYYLTACLANVVRMRWLGKSESETSLFARATGISALSYMLHRSSEISERTS